ncbi:von Willebrand factor D and EGF domain-containing protein-like [Branchiostoma lanceolatum]|uniref:von Willebrand factor D and EGF domain-containing protein-like n=1 Tax=Branchiostoma lanceolatum TaxID=7740 RepID=UPI003452105C
MVYADTMACASGFWRKMVLMLIVTTATMTAQGVNATEDPCLTATEIDDPHRSTAYYVESDIDFLCDKFIDEGWYRFTSLVGGTMPTSCVQSYYCGTSSPIWMNGEHPTGDAIVDRVACSNLGIPDDCCTGQYPIQVKRCTEGGNTYYVYKLTPTHFCEAYCAGTAEPCPDGEVNNSFHRSCGDVVPTLTEDPVLHPPVVNDDFTQVTFTCEVKYDSDDVTASFEVSFLFDNEYFDDVANKILTVGKRHATMDAIHLGLNQLFPGLPIEWHSKMGKDVSCQVRAFWENSPTVKSDWRQSNTYWAGIQAEEHVVQIDEAAEEPYTLRLYSTVPFVCRDGDRHDQCNIDLPFSFDANDDDVSANDGCQARFHASDWSDEDLRIEAEPKLVAVKDGQADRDKHMVINFGEITHLPVGLSPHIFNGYTPQFNIQVRTVNAIEGNCRSSGDPHIIMTDRYIGRSGFREQAHVILPGEFILYRSTKPNRVFEVQARHKRCAGEISCNCGVAVREGNDAVIIDKCYGHISRAPVVTYKTATGGPLSPAVIVKRDAGGRRFRVTMPSGAYVEATGTGWMTITVHAPGIDFGHTEGLCGPFDGNPDNDLMMPDGTIASHHIWPRWHRDFSLAWRITPGTSLFDADCLLQEVASPLSESQFCTCAGGESVECDWTRTQTNNNVAQVNVDVVPGQAQENRNCAQRRKKREVQNIEDDPLLYNDDVDVTEYVFDYGDGSEPVVNDQWPTPILGITEQRAREYCQESIWNLTIAEVCQDYYGVDIQEGVDSCMADIKVTEDFQFADIVVQRVQADCAERAYNNVSLYETNENGTAVPPAFITANICPRQCSNQGRCVNSTCECNEGYTSADCSIQIGRPPVALELPGNGLCDVRSRPCMKTSFFVDGVMDSENLTCRIKQVQIEDGQLVQQDSTGRSEATFRSFADVSCVLPRSPVRYGTPATNEGAVAHGMLLSVSNDGERFSEELFFTVYDSVCQECSQGGDCTWKPETCIIRGHCFRNGDPNPDNWCQQCRPDLSNNTWSDRPVNNPPRFTMASTTIRKLPDESLTVTLGAEDPEGRPITFQAASPSSPAVTLQPNGELTWTGDEDQPHSINITIEDECDASSEQTFELTTMACLCENGGSCVPDPDMPRGQGFYTCVCPGYIGDVCETELDECQSDPCANGTCTDLVDGYNCTCAEGYIGTRCDVSVDNRCALDPCFPEVSCINLEDGGYSCGRCPSGYAGNGYECEDIDECDTDTHGCLHVCKNQPGTYECACTDGFLLIADDCLDVDECGLELDECSHDCTNTDGSYTCTCPAGYELHVSGKTCDDVNECASSPCQNGGECQDGVDQYTCLCARGWLGTHCEEDIHECVLTNHGCEHQCVNTPGSYGCSCPTGYVLSVDGKSCEDDDECHRDESLCSYICANTEGSYTCICQPGYSLIPGTGECGNGPVTEHPGHSGATETPGHDKATEPQGHNEATEPQGHNEATEPQGHNEATEPQGHNEATEPQGHNEATEPQGHNEATEPQGHSEATEPQGHNEATEPQGHNEATDPQGHNEATEPQGHNEATEPQGHSEATEPQGHNEATEPPGPTASPTSTNEDDCRYTPCTVDHQECVEDGGTYSCRCTVGYYSAIIGTTTRCRESVKYPAEFEVTVTHIGGEELVFTPELSDTESEEFRETAMVLETALNGQFGSSRLGGRYKGAKVTSFRRGSVIARFDVYLSQGPAADDVEDALYDALEDNAVGSSGVRIVPSSFKVTETEDDPTTPWYQEPLYLALVCVGCAVGVTIAVVALMCYCKNNRPIRKRHITGAYSESELGGGEPVHLSELRGAENKSFDDRQPANINFVAPKFL